MISKGYLDDLKKGVLLTGRLSEIHIKNMSAYPYVFFDNISSVDIDYNINTAAIESSYINFYLKSKKKKIVSLDKRLRALKISVETLLWKGVSVSVYLNGSELKSDATR